MCRMMFYAPPLLIDETGVEATFMARVWSQLRGKACGLPHPGAMNVAATHLWKCVEERGAIPGTTSILVSVFEAQGASNLKADYGGPNHIASLGAVEVYVAVTFSKAVAVSLAVACFS